MTIYFLSGIVGALVIVVGVLAFVLARMRRRVDALAGFSPIQAEEGGVETGVRGMEHNLVGRVARLEAWAGDANGQLEILHGVAEASIQKVGFRRFNPFEDTGGDNSFVLALLDRQHNGVLISSLYNRDSVRVYGKRVERGRTPYPLIDEERAVLKETIGE